MQGLAGQMADNQLTGANGQPVQPPDAGGDVWRVPHANLKNYQAPQQPAPQQPAPQAPSSKAIQLATQEYQPIPNSSGPANISPPPSSDTIKPPALHFKNGKIELDWEKMFKERGLALKGEYHF
ncbi:hypothetical protein [Prosthecobacter sp.]|uniref:hypothetical protein n=1 Tax=Prosthecobacter sp. TaxID=1965333 RepID=UPI00378401A1